MIELENDGIRLMAVHAGMLDEVIPDKATIYR